MCLTTAEHPSSHEFPSAWRRFARLASRRATSALRRIHGWLASPVDVESQLDALLAQLQACWASADEASTTGEATVAGPLELVRLLRRCGEFEAAESLQVRGWPMRLNVKVANRLAQALDPAPPDEAPSLAEIAGDDGRWLAVREWAAGLPSTVRVLEIGCGAGRYLRRLSEQFPHLTLTGVDPRPDRLRAWPRSFAPRAQRLAAALPCLPWSDGAFDAVLVVEVLEHVGLPRRAVAEICRVLRPGGGLLIIDKHKKYQARSVHQPWERWFWPQEVLDWLSPSAVGNWKPITHAPGRRPHDLFLAWTATRRVSA